MEFRVLGPVEAIASSGAQVGLGPRQSRFVLGVLALEVGRPVSVDRLVGLMWPGDPPRTAEHALAVAVSTLRGCLAAEAPIARRGRSYELCTEPSTVDASRFRGLTAAARIEPDAAAAARLLGQALGLWRGELLACCAPPGAEFTLRHGLAEARLAAVEDHAEARLRLGQHRLLIDELADLTARHPLRERLAALLMLALHRDGRTADALAVYDAIRCRLADDLGLDPGPALRSVHGTVLRAEAEGTGPAPPAADVLRVVLVDDHPLFRAGMRTALETGTEIIVVGEAEDGAGALRVVAATTPDVLIMDLGLPDVSGAEATRQLLERHPGLPVLVMTMSGADGHIRDALRAGARGYLMKSAGRQEVLHAVRTVRQGAAVFGADVAARITAILS